MYRSPQLKQKLEVRLNGVEGVRRVQANILTGRLLIVHGPETGVAEIIGLIETQLGARRPRRPVQKRRVHKPLKAGIVEALGGIGNLLRGLSPSYAPATAFGAAAGVAASDPVGKQMQEVHPWHVMEQGQVLERLGVAEQHGLSSEEAGVRLRLYGENSLAAGEKRSDLAIFVDQFINAPVGLLGASAVISVMTGGAVDAAVIMGVVLINAMIGFITERQSEKAIASLAKSGVNEVTVLRDGESLQVSVDQIVPGDVLMLIPGTYIAADIRLIQSHRLSIDESALTGESLPVTKDHDFVGKEDRKTEPCLCLGHSL